MHTSRYLIDSNFITHVSLYVFGMDITCRLMIRKVNDVAIKTTFNFFACFVENVKANMSNQTNLEIQFHFLPPTTMMGYNR